MLDLTGRRRVRAGAAVAGVGVRPAVEGVVAAITEEPPELNAVTVACAGAATAATAMTAITAAE